MSGTETGTWYALLTADEPGAIAILQVWGSGAEKLLEKLLGRPLLADRAVRANLAGIDDGLVMPVGGGVWQIMPHGGRGVVRGLTEKIESLGAKAAEQSDPVRIYPEARTPLEAWMLQAMAQAASPAAINLLLRQPELWQNWMTSPGDVQVALKQSEILNQLLYPPRLTLVGAANVGKSTLTNRMAHRQVSLEQDQPGTTRDWVRAGLLLTGSLGEVAVDWHDTPGRRPTDDPVEQQAIALSQTVIRESDLILFVRDPDHDWVGPEPGWPPDRLFVLNKQDKWSGPLPEKCSVAVSALTGEGLAELARTILEALGLEGQTFDLPWAFCPPLKAALEQTDRQAMGWMLGPVAGGLGGR